MLKKIFLTGVLCCISFHSFSQEIKYKEYSYSKFFQLIEEEKDSIFKLSDALIKYNAKTDTLFVQKEFIQDSILVYKHPKTIKVNKHLALNNVQFLRTYVQLNNKPSTGGILQNIVFNKSVKFNETLSAKFLNCTFYDEFEFIITKKNNANLFLKRRVKLIDIRFCDFYNIVGVNLYSSKDESIDVGLVIKNNNFYIPKIKTNSKFFTPDISIHGYKINTMILYRNNVRGFGNFFVSSNAIEQVALGENNFSQSSPNFSFTVVDSRFLQLSDNIFENYVLLELDEIKTNFIIDWNQFKGKVLSADGFLEWNYVTNGNNYNKNKLSKENLDAYSQNARIKNNKVFKLENTIRGQFFNHFKEKMDNEYANIVYTEIKDLETFRSEFLYEENPSFKTFFKWRINQFLKVFSGYGTEPERAVVFSMYVILIFAFVYLLFPNSWDSYGKKRLMHRFEFFQKYLRRKEGMHAIYLEDKQEEISSYEDFKTNLENSKTELPAFFVRWSKPLYNASMISSKMTAKFLQNTDILKGKWQDLSAKQKRFKNIQIGFLLLLGLLYDLFIKALNALMLSINTFTTLGFGEIPIKGLPRYLAIIQGFIGWFMLTIFSVSLISQLLN